MPIQALRFPGPAGSPQTLTPEQVVRRVSHVPTSSTPPLPPLLPRPRPSPAAHVDFVFFVEVAGSAEVILLGGKHRLRAGAVGVPLVLPKLRVWACEEEPAGELLLLQRVPGCAQPRRLSPPFCYPRVQLPGGERWHAAPTGPPASRLSLLGGSHPGPSTVPGPLAPV